MTDDILSLGKYMSCHECFKFLLKWAHPRTSVVMGKEVLSLLLCERLLERISFHLLKTYSLIVSFAMLNITNITFFKKILLIYDVLSIYCMGTICQNKLGK